jgi:predicted ATP-dependent protease
MSFKLTLRSYSTKELKKEISATNIKGYSKMRREELIEFMVKHQERFKHLTLKVKPVKTVVKKEKAINKLPKKEAVKKVENQVVKKVEKMVKKEVKKRINVLGLRPF